MDCLNVLELQERKIDFDVPNEDAKARLTLVSDNKCDRPRLALIAFRAIVKGQIHLVDGEAHVKVSKHGKFSFSIPCHTIAIEVEVIASNSYECFAKLRGYFPPLYKVDFTSNSTSVRLTIKHCNTLAVDTSGLDHSPVLPGEDRIGGHQLGPGRSSRAMAIVHLAMFEAMNAIIKTHKSHVGLVSNEKQGRNGKPSVEAAIYQATHDTLVWLYPSHRPRLGLDKEEIMSQLLRGSQAEKKWVKKGIVVGKKAAAAVIALRTDDGSSLLEPTIGVDYFPSDAPGEWRMDPISQIPKAIGANWSKVTPFIIGTADKYRCPPPPALDSAEYAAAFNEVKALGGDGVTTTTVRSAEQTFIGVFYAYDGMPSLCAPPRLYNQIARTIADTKGLDSVELLHMLALINVAMADAAIACWDSKYHHKFWRPVTAIREADQGTGPSGLGDGNAATVGDVTWTPLGAPASNLTNGVNFTPPFCAYPSGHSTFMPAVGQVLRHILGTDEVSFTFVSDEYNGKTVDAQGNVRPLHPRHFSRISQVEDENGDSRIFLGIHFKFDKTAGAVMGHAVADEVFEKLFQKLE